MDITGLNIQNPASFYADSINMSSSPAAGAESFVEILKRALASQNAGSAVQAHSQLIDKNDRLYELCLELETFLVKNLLSSMRSTVQKSGLVDDSFAGKMYEDMLWEKYAKDFTRNASFGLAEQAYRQLTGQ